MSMFSSSDKKKDASESIPFEIRQAVSVMGDTPSSAPTQPKAPTGNSPFLDGGLSASSPVPAPAPALKPLFDEDAPKPASKSKYFMWGGIGIIGVLLVGGMVYWYMTQSGETAVAPEAVPAVTETTIRVTPVEPEPTPVLPFSLTGPNYLSLDTETVTEASFQVLLSEKKQAIVEAGIVQPVEFLLTDKNNNPVAFSRVAYLMNIDLSQPFLASIAESFSLYLYNDQGRVRPGLALSFGTVDGPTLFAKEREGSFPSAFRSFLYEGMTVPREVTFRSGAYRDQTVRYVNIDETTQTSFDYALRGTTWFIGTSKETLRALLDTN